MMKRNRPPFLLARQSGNVLIMSIFIAAFLFFLSAALVAQNRQNILLVLSEDNRMRAANNADAGLDLALHVMRNNPQWPTLLPGYKGEFASGGSWQIESIDALPNLPHILQIKSRGTCSFFASSKTRYVEEIPFAEPSYATPSNEASKPTHIFTYADVVINNVHYYKLVVLTPDMRWQILGDPPAGVNTLTILTANEGPLFSRGGLYRHVFRLEDLNNQGKKANKVLSSDSDAISVLYKKNDAIYWSSDKYPCSGKVKDIGTTVKITAKANNDSKTINSGTESLTKYSKEETSGVDYYGPTLEWYTASEGTLAADKQKVYCFGIHHYYQGTHARMTNKGYQIIKPAKEYKSTCILCYNSKADSWSVSMDTMRIISRTVPPEIKNWNKNNSPSMSSLVYFNGSLHSYSSGNQRHILGALGNNWQRKFTCNPLGGALFGYQNKPLYHEEKHLGAAGYPAVGLNLTGLLEGLYLERPAISLSSGSRQDTIKPKFYMFPNLRLPNPNSLGSYLGDNNVAVCGKHIYAYVKMFAVLEQPSETLKNDYPQLYASLDNKRQFLTYQSRVTLAHYDGEVWQLWPNGLNDLAANWNDNLEYFDIIYDKYTGVTATLDTHHLAAAKYDDLSADTAYPSINRYSVLLDKDDK